MDSLKELVEKAAAGDVAAFGRLIGRYQDAVYGVGVAVLGNFHDAQDVAQEVFVQAWRELKTLRDPEKFPGWVCRIARNRCLDLLRKRPEKTLPPDSADPVASPSTEPRPLLEASERRDAVLQAIGRLSEPLRVPTTLFYINGYSEKDVSRMIARPVGTVKRRLHDARKQLRKELMNMVESELKDSRPGPQLADHVLRRIRQVRVHLSGGQAQHLVLTDSKNRSFLIIIGALEAKAIQPWLARAGSPEALDIHTALVRVMDRFHCRIAGLTISEIKMQTFYATLKVKSQGRVAAVDCRPSDGLNFAVRAKMPILADNAVVEQALVKDKDGKPLSPEAAWRSICAGTKRAAPFQTLPDILRTLEKDPENTVARRCLGGVAIAAIGPVKRTRIESPQTAQAMPQPTKVLLAHLPPDPNRMEKLAAWTRKCEGAKLEGVVAGLVGAAYLLPPQPKLQEAIPLLEKARKLQPDDERIAFDLATAYSMAGRAQDALSLLPKEEFATARSCGNFRNLWRNAHFRSAVGTAEESGKNNFVSGQLDITRPLSPVSRPGAKGAAKKWPGPPFPKDVWRLGKLSQARTRLVQRLLGRGRLLRVGLATGRLVENAATQRLTLVTEHGRAVALEVDFMDFANIGRALQQSHMPRPMTDETFCNVLRAVSIRIEAAVLTRRGRGGIEAALIVTRDGQREAITLTGPAALSIAFRAKRPVLIAETLAEHLYVRDKTGKPVSTERALRFLHRK